MAKRIPQSDIDEVLSRVSIVDVVSDYVALKASGNGEFKGLCPFHGEKSPSFGVSATKNLWHCFGCQCGGGPIDWVMKLKGVSFRHAVELLKEDSALAAVPGEPVKRSTVRALPAASYWRKSASNSAPQLSASPGHSLGQKSGHCASACTRCMKRSGIQSA